MKNGIRTLLLLIGDILALILAFWAMLYTSFFGRLNETIIQLHLFPFSILGLVWLIIFFIFNLYNTQLTRPTIPHLRQISIAFVVAVFMSVVFFYSIPFFGITPKTNLFIFATFAFLFFILWRRIFYNIFSSYFRKSLVLIVDKEKNKKEINDLEKYIKQYPQSGFILLGIYQSLTEFTKSNIHKIPEAFIVSKEVWREPENFKNLYGVQSEIIDLTYAYEDILGKIPVESIDEDWFIHNIRFYKNDIYDLEKRVSSIIISILCLIITSPLLICIALAIKLSDGGPIFYYQSRIGKGGKNFILYKFRSMVVDAEKNGPKWSSKNDARITPLGRILRKLHIDELPQMINILKGDIYIVGPRPERPIFVSELEKEIPFYNLRHIISPGFTGWAQIKFHYARNIMESKEKFEYDLYYLKNRNIFMDLGIMLKTIQIIFTH